MVRFKNAEEKRIYMTQTPLRKLVLTLSVPTVVSMLITSLYNMADTFFVGMLYSESATGAVGVVLPLMTIMQAVGFMFGHGSGNYMARALGGGNEKDAEKMAVTGFVIAFAIGVAIAVGCFLNLKPLAFLLGATPTIAPYAMEYIAYLLPGAPFLIASLVLNNQLRFQGSAFYAMFGIISGALCNVILDPILIFHAGLGVAGAALATSISQTISFVMLYVGTLKGSNIQLHLKNLSFHLDTYKEILRGGLPSLGRQGFASISIVFFNTVTGSYGDAAVAAMSIVSRVMMIANSAIIGFGQGFQPICGFNYGAKCYGRVVDCFWFCVRVSFVVLFCISLCGLFFAEDIISIFLQGNAEVEQIGALCLRMQCIFFPLLSFVIFSNMMLQTLGMAGKATILAMARQGVFFIPAIYLLEAHFGLFGIQISQAVSDVCSFLLSLPIALGVLNSLKKLEKKEQAQLESK